MPLEGWFVVRRGAVASEFVEPKLNSARSCDSVSLIRDVISWECSKALVNILGAGNLVEWHC